MTAESERRLFQYWMPNLDIPNPPSSLSYAELADFQNREILKANGIRLSETALRTALEETTNILQAAAAHMNGTLPSLSGEGEAALVECLSYPLDAYISPLVAAGYVAQLGDPQGFPVIVKGLDSNLAAVRSVASKQLYFFASFHGSKDKQGNAIDLVHQFERALDDPDTGIQWQALVQLREVALPGVAEFLE